MRDTKSLEWVAGGGGYYIQTTGCPEKCIQVCLNNISCYKNAKRLGHILFKGGIHGYVWSTKTFLSNIREPIYRKIKIGYQISKSLDIGQSSVLESDIPHCFDYISTSLCCSQINLNLKHATFIMG